MILFVDSATSDGFLAIADEHDLGIDELISVKFRSNLNYSEKLFSSFDFIVRETDVDYSDINKIVVSVGPGSFTGLRIAYSFARALSLTTDAEFIGVSTLWSYLYSMPEFIDNKLVILKSTAKDVFLLAKKGLKVLLDETIMSLEDLERLNLDGFVATGYRIDNLDLDFLEPSSINSIGMYRAYKAGKTYDSINYIKKSYAEC